MSVNGFDDSKNKKEVYTKEEVYTKDDYAKVTITSDFDGSFLDEEGYGTASITVNYPDGFNKENSFLISHKLTGTTEGGSTIFTPIENHGVEYKVQFFIVMFRDDGIEVTYQNGSVNDTMSIKIELLLMKI